MSREDDVDPIKNAQFGFLNFLWLEMKAVREKQKLGEYYTALNWLMSFISYLGEDFQKKLGFKERVERIKSEIAKLHPTGCDEIHRIINYKKMLNDFAKVELDKLITDLSFAYDKKGYYEIKGPKVEYGSE